MPILRTPVVRLPDRPFARRLTLLARASMWGSFGIAVVFVASTLVHVVSPQHWAPLAGLAASAVGLLTLAYKGSALWALAIDRLRRERRAVQDASDLHHATIEVLAMAIEAKDSASYGHLRIRHVPFPMPIAPLIESHHERWDGTGYPKGLRSVAIPPGARIIVIVDRFGALMTDRPHRSRKTRDQALDMLRAEAGTGFDPRLVETFIRILPEVERAHGGLFEATAMELQGSGGVGRRRRQARAATRARPDRPCESRVLRAVRDVAGDGHAERRRLDGADRVTPDRSRAGLDKQTHEQQRRVPRAVIR